ncbi:hypothetical protein Sango_1245600 [Sesamum angolense]|uniref:Uncharacterized protein n=1 Tax=Sesamum angolense TaxID=2727404 RepID=A0AAE2BU08_9LAMI|nr:hypothetical protein Sango_1245600 [Sesamum angolense]
MWIQGTRRRTPFAAQTAAVNAIRTVVDQAYSSKVPNRVLGKWASRLDAESENGGKQQQGAVAVGEQLAAVSSCLESKLFVCKKDQPFSLPGAPLERPAMFPIPKSQVLGKVKDFLGVISESNKKLLQEAKDNPENYDIEVLSGKESEVIEMDLMLGVADLHTPEAVAAAESAIAGYQPTMPLSERSSGSENEDSSNEDDDNNEDNISEQDNNAASDCVKFESKNAKRDSSREPLKKRKKKRTKIIELT